jgi:hypothetical protein
MLLSGLTAAYWIHLEEVYQPSPRQPDHAPHIRQAGCLETTATAASAATSCNAAQAAVPQAPQLRLQPLSSMFHEAALLNRTCLTMGSCTGAPASWRGNGSEFERPQP